MKGSFTCSYPGCDRHPSKGDTILRISAKGSPFIGRCEEHYGPEGERVAREVEEATSCLLAYQGKKDCSDPRCTRKFVNGKASKDCIGWHCPHCHEPCSMMGHRACQEIISNG